MARFKLNLFSMFASSSLQLVVKNKQTKNNPDLLKQKSRMINKICRATKWVGVWGPGIALGELLPCKKPGARLPFCRNWKGSSEALGYGLCCILEGILTASHSLWHSLKRGRPGFGHLIGGFKVTCRCTFYQDRARGILVLLVLVVGSRSFNKMPIIANCCRIRKKDENSSIKKKTKN